MRRSLLASFTTVFRYNMRQYSKDVLVLWSGWWTEYFMVKWLRNRKAVVNIKDHSLICSESTTPLKEKKIQKREVCVTYECRDAHIRSSLHCVSQASVRTAEPDPMVFCSCAEKKRLCLNCLNAYGDYFTLYAPSLCFSDRWDPRIPPSLMSVESSSLSEVMGVTRVVSVCACVYVYVLDESWKMKTTLLFICALRDWWRLGQSLRKKFFGHFPYFLHYFCPFVF